jgi:hypothetical protein
MATCNRDPHLPCFCRHSVTLLKRTGARMPRCRLHGRDSNFAVAFLQIRLPLLTFFDCSRAFTYSPERVSESDLQRDTRSGV